MLATAGGRRVPAAAQLSQSQQPAGTADASGGPSVYGTADTVFAALFTAELR